LVLSSPRPIVADDRLEPFDCGNEMLNDWLRRQARKSEGTTARTYIVKEGEQVAGYYCLAAGGVARTTTPRKMRHGLPDPVPVMVLGRLAVDLTFQRRGIGSGLLRDALRRTLQVSRQAGLRAMLVHAIDDEAAAFYSAHGFIAFPPGTRTLYLPIEAIAAAL
jgi:GNAT superfamily N-acetyltransferase